MNMSLKTLGEHTPQQVFDFVVAHLRKQGVVARRPDERMCSYRVFDGSGACILKCAAGCLIADDEYRADLEGRDWPLLIDKGDVPSHHQHLIRRLQRLHDHTPPVGWEESFQSIAEEYDLVYSA